MRKTYYVYRSSITGLFVPKHVAEADPEHHVKERLDRDFIFHEEPALAPAEPMKLVLWYPLGK